MSDDTPTAALGSTTPKPTATLDPATRRQIRVRRLRRDRETAARRRLLLTLSATSTGGWSRL